MTSKLSLFLFLCAAGCYLGAADTPAETAAPPENKEALVISSLPDNIKLIIGQAKDTFYVPRVKAIHALPTNMPQDQIDACYDFLYQKLEKQSLPDLQFNGLKNELVFALMKQRRKPAELAGHLVKMYKDKSYDTTWRDYCVQFFGKWYPNAPDNQGRKEMVAGLWDALKNERDTRIAGAASSQLCFLARKHPEFSKDEVSAASLDALTDPKCANISKVALLQTCAILGNEKALPVARKIAATEKNPLMRASAIAAIGTLGNQEDLKFLRELETSSDMRLQIPAQAAIQKITVKSQQ